MATSRPKKKNKHTFLKILVVVLIIGGVFFFVNKNFAESALTIPESPASQSSEIPWWNGEYAYRKKIDINLDKKGFVELNHASLSIDLKSNDDGSDIAIIGNTGNKSV